MPSEADMMRLADRYRRELREDHPPKPKHQHVFYNAEDFTPAEIARRNILAVLVIEQGATICKNCDAMDSKYLTEKEQQ